MGIPSGGGGNGIKVGGGIGGLVILVLVLLLQSQLAAAVAGSATDTSARAVRGPARTPIRTGTARCVADVNSIQGFWQEALPEQTGTPYRRAQTILFTGGADTGCGGATSDVGPFYCPVDETVYLDTTFFDDMLEGQLGAAGRTVRRGVRARPRVRPPRPEPPGHDGPGAHPAGRRPATPCGWSSRPTATPGSGRRTPPRCRTRAESRTSSS